jgi:hypothetical protein
MVWYLRVVWHHDFPEDPVELYSEVGDDGYEIRKVQVFGDGRLEFADETRETEMTGLSEAPIGPVSDIARQEEFSPSVIGRQEFEEKWQQALAFRSS